MSPLTTNTRNESLVRVQSRRFRNKRGWLVLIVRYEVNIREEKHRQELCSRLAREADDKRQFCASFDDDLLFVLWGRRLQALRRTARRRNGARNQLLAHVTKTVERAVEHISCVTEDL